jgi:hypothetical protein
MWLRGRLCEACGSPPVRAQGCACAHPACKRVPSRTAPVGVCVCAQLKRRLAEMEAAGTGADDRERLLLVIQSCIAKGIDDIVSIQQVRGGW